MPRAATATRGRRPRPSATPTCATAAWRRRSRAPAAPAAPIDGRRAALARMARWGITPLAVQAPTVGGLEEPRAARRRSRSSAGVAVDARHARPAPCRRSPSPSGRQLATLPPPKAPTRSSAACAPPPSPGCGPSTGAGAAPRLDPDWIETVAPVRRAVARLEAVQLGSGYGRAAARCAPGPTAPATRGRPSRRRRRHRGPCRPSRLIAAFGPPAATRPAGTPRRARGRRRPRPLRRDRPRHEHVRRRRLPHELPTARAPQAIVLAVPPDLDEPLTHRVLVDIVAEITRPRPRSGGRRRPARPGRRRAAPRGADGRWRGPASAGRSLTWPTASTSRATRTGVHAARARRSPGEALRARVHDPAWFLAGNGSAASTRRATRPRRGCPLTVTRPLSPGRRPRRGRPADHTARGDDRGRARAVVDARDAASGSGGAGRAVPRRAPRRPGRSNSPGSAAPYDRLNGRASTASRSTASAPQLGSTVAPSPPSGVPPTSRRRLAALDLAYAAAFTAGPVALDVPRHDGGDVDWYSGRPAAVRPAARLDARPDEPPDPRQLRRRADAPLVADRPTPLRPGRRRPPPHLSRSAADDPRHRRAR